jgi:predicted NAD/FAD-binding protein
LEYQGSSLNGLFAQRQNCFRPSFLRMLIDIARFNRHGMDAAATGELKDGRTVGDVLKQCRVGRRFVDQYLLPMAAAIWSSNPRTILGFPAEFLIGFFANHGLLQLRDRPQWRTIVGGARTYVAALLEPIRDRIRLRCAVASVARTDTDVIVTTANGTRERFDEVVFACHADQALETLADPTRAERQILNAFPYQPNEAVLHTDTSLLPRRSLAWASWNYHIPRGEEQAASVTYDLSRLQNHASPAPILLTLNTTAAIDGAKIIRTFHYTHPAYSRDSITAQQRHGEISGQRRTHYCGAYWGYGFHEDGVNSALAVARHFRIDLQAIQRESGASTRRAVPAIGV